MCQSSGLKPNYKNVFRAQFPKRRKCIGSVEMSLTNTAFIASVVVIGSSFRKMIAETDTQTDRQGGDFMSIYFMD